MANQLWAVFEAMAMEESAGDEIVLAGVRFGYSHTQAFIERLGVTEEMYPSWQAEEDLIASDNPDDYDGFTEGFIQRWEEDKLGILI